MAVQVSGYRKLSGCGISDYRMEREKMAVQVSSIAPRHIVDNIRFAGQDKKPPSLAPRIGEHSRQILDELGYSGEQISTMIASGSIGEPALDEE